MLEAIHQLLLTGCIPSTTLLNMAPPRKRNKMIRHEMQFSLAMLTWLRLEAKRQDTSVAAIIRQAVLRLMESAKS